MNWLSITRIALRNALYEYKRTKWSYRSDAIWNWEEIPAIPDVAFDEDCHRAKDGIFHRSGSVIYRAYHFRFTMHAFNSVADANKFMEQINTYTED